VRCSSVGFRSTSDDRGIGSVGSAAFFSVFLDG
jgi:hypothetical protein